MAKCNGGSDGSITISPSGGTPGYTYSKDGGDTYKGNQQLRTAASASVEPQGFTFSGLKAGTYAIRVKDANNCVTEVKTVTVTEPTAVSVTPGAEKSVIRGFGGPNSTCTDLSANASGGTPGTNPDYTYTWTPGNLTGPTVNVCPEQTTTYTVTAPTPTAARPRPPRRSTCRMCAAVRSSTWAQFATTA